MRQRAHGRLLAVVVSATLLTLGAGPAAAQDTMCVIASGQTVVCVDY